MERFNPTTFWGLSLEPVIDSAQAFASANIALIKYWGKKDELLNLATHSSLSLSLGHLGTHVHLSLEKEIEEKSNQAKNSSHFQPPFYHRCANRLWINDEEIAVQSSIHQRITTFLAPFQTPDYYFKVHSYNTIPTGAGLASSASSYAALALALNQLFGWKMNTKQLSILARLGSGSAARSIFQGFSIWHEGSDRQGLDSFATPLNSDWSSLRWAVALVSDAPKAMSSRVAMQATKSCFWSEQWPTQSRQDLAKAVKAIQEKNFTDLGLVMEHSCMTMHALMMSCEPAICYWLPQTLAIMQAVYQMRQEGLYCYFTIDAGPNVKILYQLEQEEKIKRAFESICDRMLWVNPWILNSSLNIKGLK